MKFLSAAVVTAVAVAAPAVAGNEDHKNKLGGSDAQTFPCGSEADNLVVFNGDTALWPPNHKYAPYAIDAVDGEGNNGSIRLTTRVSHDEYLTDWIPSEEEPNEPEEEVGAGNTVNDARPFIATDSGSGTVTTTHEIRAERSGRGDGRTYTFYIHAEFDQDSCDIEVPVNVPHDMRSENAPAKEDKTDSTGPDQG